MKIPFSKPHITQRELDYVSDAVISTWLSGGEYVEKFEDLFAKLLGSTYAISTSNGTSAIQLALQSLGLGEGDDVIFPGFCFQAGANVALQLGINPIFADIKPMTLYIDPEDVERCITENTKAVFVVHNYGYPCDLNPIIKLCNDRQLFLIEDCAEALFSSYGTKFCGRYGHVATFSFHATKTVTTGEGGMLVTDDSILAGNAKLMRSHGLEVRGTYNHVVPGNNYRMSNILAAMGLAQLEDINNILSKKRLLYHTYRGILHDKDGLYTYSEKEYTSPSLWSFPVELHSNRYSSKEEVIKQLAAMEIEVRPGFVSADRIGYMGQEGLLTNSSFLSDRVIVLPMYTDMTTEEVEYVCSSLLNLRS